MARKSSLSDKQWADIEKRILAGERIYHLSKEYKVPDSTIRTRLSIKTAKIKEVANQVIEAENAFNALDVSAKISAKTLIDELREISTHLAAAARYGAITSHRLSGLANVHAAKLDDIEPNHEDLATVAKLTALANESAKTGLNLLAANKDRQIDPPKPAKKLNDFYTESSVT